MPLRPPIPANQQHPLSHEVRKRIAFNGPIPGQSLTKPKGQMPWEHPPKFTKLKDAMHWLMDQLTEPFYMKQLLQLMDGGIPVEAITRTLIFSGFTTGKWTPDLGMLLYKPLMLSVLALAHRSGLKDTPVLVPRTLSNYHSNKLKQAMTVNKAKDRWKQANTPISSTTVPEAPTTAAQGGFMSLKQKNSDNL